MNNITEEEKGFLAKKYSEFKLNGLVSYRDYLVKELEKSENTSLRQAYNTYLEKEIEKTNAKIDSLEGTDS